MPPDLEMNESEFERLQGFKNEQNSNIYTQWTITYDVFFMFLAYLEARGLPAHVLGSIAPRMQQFFQRAVPGSYRLLASQGTVNSQFIFCFLIFILEY